MTHRYVAVLMIFAGACVIEADDADPGARRPLTVTGAALDDAAIRTIVAEATPSSCVEDGCPTGQTCDWIAGCTEEVTFCCADEQCGDGRFCDFEAGGLCAPKP